MEKTCRRCGERKPASEFRQNAKLRDGLSSWCSECHREAIRRWRAAHPEYQEAYNERRRVVLPDGGYRRVCVVCGVEFLAQYKYALVCGPGKCRNRRRYLQGDPEKRRLRDRTRGPQKIAARRERLSVAVDSAVLASAAYIKVLLETAKTCDICRKRLSDKPGHPRKKHVDHIVPLADGGTHTVGNLRVLCATCNLSRPRDSSDVDQESLWARVG